MSVEVDAEKWVDNRPGIIVVGSSNVGKRTLLSRLLSLNFEDASYSSSGLLVHGWTISTKYYTADVSIWMVHLQNGFSITSLPVFNHLAALVLVFDTSDLASLIVLQDWVSVTDIQKFDILLCIGNKVDLVPGHSAHAEYRQHLQKLSDSSVDPCIRFTEYGISETEGSRLLGGGEQYWEIRRSCLEWCSQHNIEYIEACASNADFDKCLSVDGDSQGVERLYGALSAHMWPGMILKSGNKIIEPSLPEKQELSEGESDYEIEYEVLSACSAEPWDEADGWISANGPVTPLGAGISGTQNIAISESDGENRTNRGGEELQPSTTTLPLQEETELKEEPEESGPDKSVELDESAQFEFENLEQLMSEIVNIRGSLRLMPDFQRREMAAKLSMKMATMFGDNSGDEEVFD